MTPDRVTKLILDVGSTVIERMAWTLQRKAMHITPIRELGANETANVFCAGGDAWLLKPQFHDVTNALQSAIGGYVAAADVTLATGFTSYNAFRKRSDLTNVGGNASVLSAGAPAFLKRVSTSADWDDGKLTADQAAFPPPTAASTAIYPQDRVLSGLVTYPANAPFLVTFLTPDSYAGKDDFFTFYWGGEADTVSAGEDPPSGGCFCVTLNGSGQATLYERDTLAGTWNRRMEFPWNDMGGGAGGKADGFAVIPYETRRLHLTNFNTSITTEGGFSLLSLLVTLVGMSINLARRELGSAIVYKEELNTVGHAHSRYMTGEGPIRVDHRRDLRLPFSVQKGIYPATGTLIDAPFEINRNLPDETPIKTNLDVYLYDNTDLTIEIYNAADDTVLSTDADGNYLSVAGQRKYYAVFTFTSSDGKGTPCLFGYSVGCDGQLTTRSGTNITTSWLMDVSITGPDLEPTQEQALVGVKDPSDAVVPILRQRDGIRSKVSVYNANTDALVAHLFEGETCQVKAQLRGMAGQVWPSAEWRDYEVRLVGLWSRLEEQFHDAPPWSFANSAEDPYETIAGGAPAAPGDSETGTLPWKVTNVIKWLLNHAGVDLTEMDVPDLDLRLWPLPGQSVNEYTVQPGTAYGTMASDLIRNILGYAFLYDPNAGTAGMWRVLPTPALSSTNFLQTFDLDAPPNTGQIPTYPTAYGANTTYVLKDTFHSYLKRPVANVISVYGQGSSGNSAMPNTYLVAVAINADSINDPTSPDYLEGRMVPATRGPDPALATQEACNWVCRRMYDQLAKAQKWFEWSAPLVLVDDTADTLQNASLLRPLRVNDLVYLRRGEANIPVILRSVNPNWSQSDGLQAASYEGRLFQATIDNET